MIRQRTGRRCPPWCAGGHRCTAQYGYQAGEHRSRPISVQTSYGLVICTRVQSLGGRSRLEIRLEVDLASQEQLAEAQAVKVADEVDRAVVGALAGSRAFRR
jgi:hypothetical protein